MKKLVVLVFTLLSFQVVASDDCQSLDEGVIYKIETNVSMCFNGSDDTNLIYSGPENTSLIAVTNGDKESMLFPNDYQHVKGQYSILATDGGYIYKKDGFIVIVDNSSIKPIPQMAVRSFARSYSAAPAPKGPMKGTGVAGAIVGAAVTGGNKTDAAVSAGVGAAVGGAVSVITKSPTVGGITGTAVATAVAEGLKNKGNISGNVIGGSTGLQHMSKGSGCTGCHSRS